MDTDEQSGRVLQLEVENFKSYRGNTVIGPFRDFTTIIGPNGSGKSNLMDAISFVLGVKTGVLRGSNLRELIYVNTDSTDPADHPDRGQVTLVFENLDGQQVRFTRGIQPSSSGENHVSQYRIDGSTVTADAYNQRLESYGILVKARNFLVFQGDIENVAQMSPKDLTAMFETISGSAALRKDYDEAEVRMKDAEAALSVVNSKRKALATEKRQKKEQKNEAERHLGLVTELDEMKIRHALWQVYHIDEDISDAKKQEGELKGAVDQATSTAGSADSQLAAHRKRQAGVAKERLLLEKQIQKKRSEAEKKNPGLIKVREEIAHAMRRLKAAEKEGETARAKARDHASKIQNLKKQLGDLEDAQRVVEEELSEGSRKGKKSLSPALLEEYNSIKKEVGAKTAQLEAEKAALQAAVDADAEALRIMQDSSASVNERIAALEATKAEDESKLKRAVEAIEKATADRMNQQETRDKLLTERRRVESRRAQLERRIEEHEGKLREAKADSKQSQREEAQRALVDHLKSTFPRGVYGMVTDLAEIPVEKHKLAVSVVMGKDFDSVIVDTSETAMQCIQIVKERRMPPMTFLPAETIRVKELNAALRNLGGSAKLAIDCITIKDERCKRAFQSICGNTLLCDTVNEARALAFEGEVRHKVVALDGTAFLKTGIITGGVTSAMEQKLKKWDQGELGKLKEERSRLAGELHQLPTLRQLTEKLQAAEAAVSRLENTIHYATADQKSTAQKVQEAVDQIAALKRERDAKTPEASRLQRQVDDGTRKVETLQRRIDEVAEKSFVAFSKKIGVGSIREYEGRHLKEAERLQERRVAISSQIARVRNQLEYEQKADPQADAANLQAEVDALHTSLTELKAQEKKFESASEAVKTELEKLASKMDELKSRLDEMDSTFKDLKKKARAEADTVAEKRRTLSSLASRLEQLRAARKDVLDAAAMENLSLPAVNENSRAKRGSKRSRNDSDAEDDDEEMDDADQGPSTSKKAPAKKKVAFDFSKLDQDDKERDPLSRSRRETEMKMAMEETSAQLSHMAPNLKAVEQYQEVQEREKEQVMAMESARKECKQAADAFNSIRQRRFDLFNAALEHISTNIDPIYKELTRSTLHPSGGQAYLSPENTEDPFSAGIKFSAMPPTKRFRDMEQLSGGEKTVAALALLFAVHSFHPSPFFVLDEVDAALDGSNVAKVAAYMRSKTRPGTDGSFQGIVISLKDTFYEKADALVGVCRDPKLGCSATMTFDLNKFGPPMGAAN